MVRVGSGWPKLPRVGSNFGSGFDPTHPYVKLYYIIIRTMRGIEIFQKPSYREIRPKRDRPMRGPPVDEFWY